MSQVLVNETSLTAIADAIREKNGETTTYKPSEMSGAISALSIGTANIPEEAFGQGNPDNSFKFSQCSWNWFMTKYADQIEPQEIASYICYYNTLTQKLPISFVMQNYNCEYAFAYCKYIREIDITSTTEFYNYNNCQSMFYSCFNLRTLPDNLFGEGKYTSSVTDGQRGSMFGLCYSLRNIPNLDGVGTSPRSDQVLYEGLAHCCYVLDTLENVPVLNATLLSNKFNYTVYRCSRLKDFTFTTDNGVAKTANWKNQTLRLSQYTGWNDGSNSGYIVGYNSGISLDTRVDDDNDYANLKDNADWWSNDYRYSRYNKCIAYPV